MIIPTPIIQTNPSFQQIGSNIIAPGFYVTGDENKDYLSTLDSDTRDYVLKHTDEFRTRQDILDCIDKLHGR